jgi:glutamate synthase (NADPH/NADH) large chain
MVDFDPLVEDDAVFLRDAVERHHAETGSAVAEALLRDWDAAVGRFGKIMPKDFKRVLLARETAEREGRDVNEAIMEAAHG